MADLDPLARGMAEAALLAVRREQKARQEAATRPGPTAPSPEEAPRALVPALEAARAYAEASRSPATRRAYLAAWRAFTSWCASPEVPPGTQPLPARPALVAAYAAHLAQLGRRPSSIAPAMAAISVAHQAAGHPSPTRTAEVRAVLAGIRRAPGAAGPGSRGKAALETPALRAALATLPQGTLRGLRDRAMLLLGFAGGLRRSELVGLDVEDLEPAPEGLKVTLRRSKTDQEGRGRLVGIPWGLHEQTCPVRAVRAWREVAGISSGPLFLTVDRAGRLLPQRCSERAVARAVQRAVRGSGGEPERYGAHSLRSGFVTSAAHAGAPTWAIQLQTGHRSLAQLHAYVRPATLFQENAARYVGL
ncbi:MAG: tyrosine-type recombinase/integrase [Candidatus Dormibacteraeota bacterium]|nr:tyrosine-type recombinase/integrase [Candidatus Dormibacteraeota bacterium]